MWSGDKKERANLFICQPMDLLKEEEKSNTKREKTRVTAKNKMHNCRIFLGKPKLYVDAGIFTHRLVARARTDAYHYSCFI